MGRRRCRRAAPRPRYGSVSSGFARETRAWPTSSTSPAPALVGDLLVSGNRVAAEIRISLADGTSLHVVDLFVVDCGLIRLLTYFVADEV